MEIAVLSDIHGNYTALEKCVHYILNRNIHTFIFLGDYVGELAYPQKTMNILYSLSEQYECYFIKGNKEDYWLNHRKNGETGWAEKDSTTGSLYYTYNNLTNKDLNFFELLKYKKELAFKNTLPLTICHGSPNKANEKLLPNDERTYAIMEHNNNAYILCGHTHVQGIIQYHGKTVLNPGAIGVPLHSKGYAQFMILNGTHNSWSHEFVSLPYDVEQVILDLDTSGLIEKAPYWCEVTKHLLRTGEISHGTVLSKAMELCREETGQCNWPDVPEKYWKQATKLFSLSS